VYSSPLLVICIAMARPMYRWMRYLPSPLPLPLTLVLLARLSSGQTTVVSTTGDAYCALQPFGAQSALVQASPPAPMNAPTASIASQVSDPHCGQTKVVATTGGAYYAPQPDPGLVIHNGQASVPPVMVPMPPPTASIAGQVSDPHCGQTKVVATTGGAYCAPQLDPWPCD
jgi:hypothetical protein